jgi:hypothetical protein
LEGAGRAPISTLTIFTMTITQKTPKRPVGVSASVVKSAVKDPSVIEKKRSDHERKAILFEQKKARAHDELKENEASLAQRREALREKEKSVLPLKVVVVTMYTLVTTELLRRKELWQERSKVGQTMANLRAAEQEKQAAYEAARKEKEIAAYYEGILPVVKEVKLDKHESDRLKSQIRAANEVRRKKNDEAWELYFSTVQSNDDSFWSERNQLISEANRRKTDAQEKLREALA